MSREVLWRSCVRVHSKDHGATSRTGSAWGGAPLRCLDSRMGANLKTGECIVGKVLLIVLVVLVALVVIGYLLGKRGGARRH